MREQQNEVALSTKGLAERDLLLVALLENAVSTAGKRKLTAGEAESVRADLGIDPGTFALRLVSKDGSVKLSADKAAQMKEICALIDTMPMRLSEERVCQ